MPRKRRARSSQASGVSGLAAALRRTTIDRSGILFTVDVLSNDLLNDAIFSCCSPKTLLRLSRVCRAALVAVRTYFHHTFDINRHLSRFFDDPISFRALQARTATLVSGSQALQFLDRSFYQGSDLDLYVHLHWRHEVGRWLLAAGYAFTASASQDPDFEAATKETSSTRDIHSDYHDIRGMSEVFTFLKSEGSPGNARKVQLMVAAASPMGIILRFHSTCVMNIITYKKAIALYPNATFERRRSLACPSIGSPQAEALSKYRNRGWEVIYTLPPDSRPGDDLAKRRRWLEDGHSWIVPLDMTDVPSLPANSTTSEALPDDPCVFTSWVLACSFLESSVEFSYLKDALLTVDDDLFYDYVIDTDYELALIINEKLDSVIMRGSGSHYVDASLLRLDMAALMREFEEYRRQLDGNRG